MGKVQIDRNRKAVNLFFFFLITALQPKDLIESSFSLSYHAWQLAVVSHKLESSPGADEK